MWVDPLADIPENVPWSPYVYTWNNPILLIDPDGRKVEWIPTIDENANISYVAEEGDTYNTFVEQYGEQAANEVFGSGLSENERNQVFEAGESISTSNFYSLIVNRQNTGSLKDVLSQSSVSKVSNMQDVFNQMQFMADYLDITKESTFNFEDFFTKTGSTFTFSGNVVDSKNNQFKLIMSGHFQSESSSILWNEKNIKSTGNNEWLRSSWRLFSEGGNDYVPTVMFTAQGRHIDKYINK